MESEQGVLWLTGACLFDNRKELLPEVVEVLEKLNVTCEIKDLKTAMICLRGQAEILKGVGDLAKADVRHRFWLIGRHLLNGGQSPNPRVKAVFGLLELDNYSIINDGGQAPMIKIAANERIIRGLNLLVASKFVC